jgi:hypothetical protein
MSPVDALRAAQEGLTDLALLNDRRRADGRSVLEVGIGLYTGRRHAW